MNENSNILSNYASQRLAVLEAENIARRVSCEAGTLSKIFEKLLAKVENRVTQYILLSRLKKAELVSSNLSDAEALVKTMRDAYSEGTMETFPSFLPSASQTIVPPPGIKASGEGRPQRKSNRPLMLYVPGGGFILPASKKQKNMIQRLSNATDCEIVVGTHRLAPENPFPCAPEDIAKQYEALLASGVEARNVFFAADTAGASVALGAMQLLRDSDADLPAGIVLFSPWCDLSLSGWSYITRSLSADSPFTMETAAFCAKLYLQNQPSTHPLASPIFASLEKFPPVLIHTSENDIHFDDAIRLAENGKTHACPVEINYWDSPRHHLERLSSRDADKSFSTVAGFIDSIWSADGNYI